MQTTFARSLRWPYRGSFQTSNSQPLNSEFAVAIFHLSVKTVSRSAGRSATAAAAYRAGAEITDERTGEIHDYARKAGVESAELFLPANAPQWASDRERLWNSVEQSEKRKNSTVAREFEVALPSELSADQRKELAHEFTRALVEKYGFAADCAIHLPGKEGDSKNHHAHILCSTRKLTPEGFTEKTRELDDRATGATQVVACRELFATMTNTALERAGQAERVDHRSLEAQGIDREPTIHLGPTATAIERRGEVSEKTQRHQERQAATAAKVADLTKQIQQAEGLISTVTNGLAVGAQMIADFEEQARQKRLLDGDPRSWYHPDNTARREALRKEQDVAVAAKTPAPVVAKPKIEQVAVERIARQPKPVPPQETEAQRVRRAVERSPLQDQAQLLDRTVDKSTAIRQERLDRVLTKVLKRQGRRQKAIEAVLDKCPSEPTGLLASFKRGAYERSMHALEPIYQRAQKLALQAEVLVQKVSDAAKQTRSWVYNKLKQQDPGLVERVEAHRMNERMEVARHQQAEREAKRALRGPDRGISR